MTRTRVLGSQLQRVRGRGVVMKLLYRLLLGAMFASSASAAFADGPGPIPEPYRKPPKVLKWIPGPCPPPHTDVGKLDTSPRPERRAPSPETRGPSYARPSGSR